MKNGEIWWCDFGIPKGSECGFRRPAVIVQNDEMNQSGLLTTVIVPLSTNLMLSDYFPNVILTREETTLKKDSVAVIHLISALDNSFFLEKISSLSKDKMTELDAAIEAMIKDFPDAKNILS